MQKLIKMVLLFLETDETFLHILSSLDIRNKTFMVQSSVYFPDRFERRLLLLFSASFTSVLAIIEDYLVDFATVHSFQSVGGNLARQDLLTSTSESIGMLIREIIMVDRTIL